MKHLARHAISSQLKDLASRPLSASYEIVEALGDKSRPCKAIASRVLAATAILRAAGDGSHSNSALETILERTEGKVQSNEQASGTLIQFNFSLAPGAQLPGSVGELIAGQLAASQATRLVNPSPPLALRSPRTDEYAEPDGSD